MDSRRILRSGLAGLVLTGSALVAGFASPSSAKECSTAPLDPRSELARADVAFVGSMTESDGSGETFTLQIDRVLKGSLPGKTVRAEVDECQRQFGSAGRLLVRDGSDWRLASSPPADVLTRAVEPLPPSATEDGVLVAGAGIGDVRALLLSADGDVVGYGTGTEKPPTAVSVCPDRKQAVFASEDKLVTRALPGLGVTKTRDAPAQKGMTITAVSCRDTAGDEVWAYLWSDAAAEMHRVTGTKGEAVWKGQAERHPAFTGGPDVFGANGTSIVRITMPRGKETKHTGLKGRAPELSASPDGRQLAGLVQIDGGARIELAIVDTESGKPRHYTAGTNEYKRVVWLDSGRFALVPDALANSGGKDSQVEVYSATSFRRIAVSTLPKDASGAINRSGVIEAVVRNTEGQYRNEVGLVRSTPGAGAVTVRGNYFDSPFFGPLAAVDPPVAPGPTTAPASTTTTEAATTTTANADANEDDEVAAPVDADEDEDDLDAAGLIAIGLLAITILLFLFTRRKSEQ